MKLSEGVTITSFVLCTALGSQHLRITPELQPTSDKKFFGKDYPDDARPVRHSFEHKLFDYPYPTVQDSDRYDKDYVKDENDDGGYWKAQMEYDALKNKLADEKREYKEALAKAAQKKAEMDKAKAAHEAAVAKEAEAAKSEKAADDAHDKAHGDIDKLKEGVVKGADEVEEEIVDLEDCKNKLIEAKAKLKKLMAEKAEAEKKEAEAQADEDAKEVIEKDAEKKEAELVKKLAEEEKEHEEALKSYEEEKEDVKKAEADLEKSAEKLRKFRKADPDGGVYEVKSGVAHVGLAFPALLVALVTLA